MDVLQQIAGSILVFIVLLDVFFTVLFPASRHGPVRKPLARWIWHGFRFVGKMTTGQRRRNFLSYSGPVVITVTLVVWFLLLVIGWAMIFKPALGRGVVASSGTTDTGWANAMYYSGFNLTTLGVGDLSPNSNVYRMLTVTAAAVGFAFFSMVITYFLSVYSSLTSRNAFAQGLHHLSGNTDDAAELLARLADGADLSEARQHLSSKAEFLRQIHQTHRFYPVLRYFHYQESYYELPRILLTTLDTATLIRSALDQERYAHMIHSPDLNTMFDAAMMLMQELTPDAQPGRPSEENAKIWREHYSAALSRLADAELHIRVDTVAGAHEYVTFRTKWDQPVRKLAETMLYEWDTNTQRSFA